MIRRWDQEDMITDSDDDVEDGVEWLSSISMQDIQQLRLNLNEKVVRGLFCIYGSWNLDLRQAEALLRKWSPSIGTGRKFVAGMIQVDESDESMESFCGDNGCLESIGCSVPDNLPALLAVVQDSSKVQSFIEIVKGVSPLQILQAEPSVFNPVKATFNSLILGIANSGKKRKIDLPYAADSQHYQDVLRIFVAGDRANVGKSSICLGLLGSLLRIGYEPADLAYIKPATQDESPQLVQSYCEKVGIHCIPVGPIVFYKGFTRAFLAGETETSQEMLENVSITVHEISRRKRVVIVDGVGYPAVGSICGMDNAAIAAASGYSKEKPLGVVIVSPSGVGHAVDSFNLNANYFESRGIPVMGAIFNKLSPDGYYSLEHCREQVSSYFRTFQPTRQPFGFVPLTPELNGDNPLDYVDEYINKFAQHVNINDILKCSRFICESQTSYICDEPMKRGRTDKNTLLNSAKGVVRLSRQEIEAQAKAAGAETKC